MFKIKSKLYNKMRVVKADEVNGGTNTTKEEPSVNNSTTNTNSNEEHIADEPQNTPNINFEQLILSARKEEKAKLYPQLQKVKKERDELLNKQNNLLLQVGEKDSKIQELQKKLEAFNNGTDLEELQKRLNELETENTQLKEEKEKARIEQVKQSEIAKFNGEVIEELINGTTEEEIKASVELANKRYVEIKTTCMSNQANTLPTSPAPSTEVVGNVGGYATGLNLETITPEMIANMSTEEYSNYRNQLGLR